MINDRKGVDEEGNESQNLYEIWSNMTAASTLELRFTMSKPTIQSLQHLRVRYRGCEPVKCYVDNYCHSVHL